MTTQKTMLTRRSFIKVTALAGGGMMLSFNWLTGCKPAPENTLSLPDEWFELNSYIKIGNNGVVTLMAPNPEFGSNVKTSLPMILAEELDVSWDNVLVEQADFYPERFDRQFTGGSQGVRLAWKPLRTAGATARQMLKQAAAQTWNVPVNEITTREGVLYHQPSGQSAGYGEMASLAATLPVPEEVELKNIEDFSIVTTSRKNVDARSIVTGKPLFTIDYQHEGMFIAMVEHPPAFGLTVKSVDASRALAMPGIKDVFVFNTLAPDYERNAFDTTSFSQMVAIVGNTTWEVMQAKKELSIEWTEAEAQTITEQGWGGSQKVNIPKGLESTAAHLEAMQAMAAKPAIMLRRDGNPEAAFKKAAKVLERTYTAPYLAHNCMEPATCFASVTPDGAEFYAPIQAPEFIRRTLSARLSLPPEKIKIRLARMGGGFGIRAYGHHLVEAGIISQKINAPVKLIYTREDDMTYGIYRPTYTATYRAALDENNNLIAFHVKAGGIPEHPVHANRFPAGAVENYLAEGWQLDSNITIGAFRAPRSNFIAGAEQAFLDELAELAGKDPIDFRLELLERAKNNPVGANNDYDPERYAGVLKLVREKSKWDENQYRKRGVAAYFCHNTYVAEVMEVEIQNGKPTVQQVWAAVDCGIVVNPDAAINMAQGGIIDGIGNALFGKMTFNNGAPDKRNFHQYRMIRQLDTPREVEVYFVKNQHEPTGLGEPLFPPAFAALANALYRATGKRLYSQPYAKQLEPSGQRL